MRNDLSHGIRQWLTATPVAGVISAALIGFLGFEYVVDKGCEFVVYSLESVLRKGTFVSVVAIMLVAEVAVVGYRNSSLYRLLNPSRSAAADLWTAALQLTGLGAIFTVVITVGATEWIPMLVRRVVGDWTLAVTVEQVWLVVAAYHLLMSFLKYWIHRFAHAWSCF